MGNRWQLQCFGIWLLAVVVLGDPVGEVSVEEASSLLKATGAELALPAFQADMSLLQFAFTNMHKLPSPEGALASSIKVVSQSPYVLVIDNFLSDRECDFLRTLGQTRLKPAMVVDSSDNWYDTQSQTRNNEQVWLTQMEERDIPLLRHILKRFHRTVRVPDEYAEALQVGRYTEGKKYEGHIDSDPAHNVARPATMLSYLNDVEEGGHTVFPVGRRDCNSQWRKHPKTGEKVYGAAVCCETPELDTPETVRVHPKKGRVVIFFSHKPDGNVDQKSQHIGCPVIKGEKWIAQRWLRYEPYNRVNYAKGPGWDPKFDGVPRKELRVAGRDEANMRVISQLAPKLYMEEHFLSAEEVTHLRSMVATIPLQDTAKTLTHQELMADAVLLNVTERALLMGRLPAVTPMQLTFKRFQVGSSEPVQMPEQAATVSVYLQTVEEGGELVFPEAHRKKAENCNEDLAACCAKSKFKLQPHEGDAVMLFSHDQRQRRDRTTKHGHCPVVKGELWVAEWQFMYQPQEQGAPASTPMKADPEVRFDNQRRTPVFLFWEAKGGAETPMGEVAGGKEKMLKSHAGHIFLVKDEAGVLVDRVIVGASVMQRVIITEKSEL